MKIAATSGEATLVPPYTCHAPDWYTATPVLGSATAETSASRRLPHTVCVCQLGLAM